MELVIHSFQAQVQAMETLAIAPANMATNEARNDLGNLTCWKFKPACLQNQGCYASGRVHLHPLDVQMHSTTPQTSGGWHAICPDRPPGGEAVN